MNRIRTTIAPLLLAFGLAVIPVAAACARTDALTSTGPGSITPSSVPGPVEFLVATAGGLAGIPRGTSTPAWEVDGAAAPDGSAAFATAPGAAANAAGGSTTLRRIDARSGRDEQSWDLTGALSVRAVAPDGRWVALTDRGRGAGRADLAGGAGQTTVVVFDPTNGIETRRVVVPGDIEPEAFSVDGNSLFALRHFDGYYVVEMINLTTGVSARINNREKRPPEDMRGSPVHAVLSEDRTLLATLYRNPSSPMNPAFVHVLDLVNGWSYCADLLAPFGTTPTGTEMLSLTPGGTLLVSNSSAGKVAEINIQAVKVVDGSQEVSITVRGEIGAALPPELATVPGFHRVVTIFP